MTISTANGDGFTEGVNLPCEPGSVYSARYNEKYKPGTPAGLVERYSGSKLGIAIINENSGQSSMILNLSNQDSFFQGTYNGLATSFVFNITYKLYNVAKKVLTNSVQYRVLEDAEELYVGPDNLLAIKLEWTRLDGVILTGWMTYKSELSSRLQQWDGTIGATIATNTSIITEPNLLWYAFYQNDRTRPTSIYSGSYLAFQSFGRVETVGSYPLNPYVGGIMQKDNTNTFGSQSCVMIDSENTIAFMISGQNNLAIQSNEGFGRGHIDYCSSSDCGKCSLAYFQVTTPNGCIEGRSGLNIAQIFTLIFGILGFIVICSVIIKFYI